MNDSEFAKYHDPFYTSNLTAEVKAARAASLDKLRSYASNGSVCRRRQLLSFFEETPPWEHCGKCDICLRRQQQQRQDAEGSECADGNLRDFAAEACLLLEALRCNGGCLSTGKLVDAATAGADARIVKRREALRAPGSAAATALVRLTKDLVKELVPLFVGAGLLLREQKTFERGDGAFGGAHGGYSNRGRQISYESYRATPMGRELLHNDDSAGAVKLPAPITVLEGEAKARAKAHKDRSELQAAGVNLKAIPQAELEQGEGKVFDVFKMWVRRQNYLRSSGSAARADANDALVARVNQWRSTTAVNLGMAPAAVLPEHLVLAICYSLPTSVEGLQQVGVRIAGADELARLVHAWKQEQQQGGPGASSSTEASQSTGGRAMQIGPDETFRPAQKWALAVYKGQSKKNPKPKWEESWLRFMMHKQHVDAIAMDQPSGKPVTKATIFRHLLTSLLHGRALDLGRLFPQVADLFALPGEEHWRRLNEVESILEMDISAVEKIDRKSMLRSIIGSAVDKDYANKDPGEKAVESVWYSYIDVWYHLKIAGFKPAFQ